MFRRLLPFLALFFLPAFALGQFTNVTATVPTLQNATYTIDFVNLSTGGPPLLGGISVFPTQVTGAFTSSGVMSVSLADNNQVLPLPSQWKFNVCIVTAVPPSPICFSVELTITGASQDISAQLSAAIPPIPTPGGGGSDIYINGTSPPNSMRSFQQGFCRATVTNGSKVVTLVGCPSLPLFAFNWPFLLGDQTNGDFVGTLSATSPTTAIMNTTATWTSSSSGAEVFVTSPDNATAANSWFSSISVKQGGGILPCGMFVSSQPILQNSANGFYVQGATKTCTWLIDAVATSHPDFLGIGSPTGNSVSHISNISVMGNSNITRGCISIFGPINATSQDYYCYDSGAASLHLNNGVANTITNFASYPTVNSIIAPVNCVVVNTDGPMTLISLTCEGSSGYEIVNNAGEFSLHDGQIDFGALGQIYNGAGGFAFVYNTLVACEEHTCTNGIENHGFLTIDGSSAAPIHNYAGSTFKGTNTFDGVTCDTGAACSLRDIETSGPTSIIDNSCIWMDGPNINGGSGTYEFNGPSWQHCSIVSGNIVNIEAGGQLNPLNGCSSFGTVGCGYVLLSFYKFPTTTNWSVTFNGQWSDSSVASQYELTYSNPTVTVNGKTVTCTQNTTSGWGPQVGQFLCYIDPSSVGFVSFGGSWTILPNGQGTPTTNTGISGSGTGGYIPAFTGTSTGTRVVGNSHIDDGRTTSSTITSSEPVTAIGNIEAFSSTGQIGVSAKSTVATSAGIAALGADGGSNCAFIVSTYSVLGVNKWFEGMQGGCTDDWALSARGANPNVIDVAHAAQTNSIQISSGGVSTSVPLTAGGSGSASIATGTSSNTDLAGQITLSGGTFTYTLTNTYLIPPIVTCSDTNTTPTAVGCHSTTTQLIFNGTGTDVINYIVIARQ